MSQFFFLYIFPNLFPAIITNSRTRGGNKCFHVLSLIVLLGLISENNGNLFIENLNLHEPFLLGSRVSLGCHYSWKNKPKPIYSVKWYKDKKEFYRYMPSEIEKIVTFPVEGIHVDVSRSNETYVHLTSIEWSSGGRYLCEVTADDDLWETVRKEAVAKVVAIPRSGPSITGQKSRYSLGEDVNLNCTSHASDPLATLTWYINSELPLPYQLKEYPWVRDDTNLMTATLGLKFRISRQNVQSDFSVKVKCTAIVEDVFLKSNEISLEVLRPQRIVPAESRDGKSKGSSSLFNEFYDEFEDADPEGIPPSSQDDPVGYPAKPVFFSRAGSRDPQGIPGPLLIFLAGHLFKEMSC